MYDQIKRPMHSRRNTNIQRKRHIVNTLVTPIQRFGKIEPLAYGGCDVVQCKKLIDTAWTSKRHSATSIIYNPHPLISGRTLHHIIPRNKLQEMWNDELGTLTLQNKLNNLCTIYRKYISLTSAQPLQPGTKSLFKIENAEVTAVETATNATTDVESDVHELATSMMEWTPDNTVLGPAPNMRANDPKESFDLEGARISNASGTTAFDTLITNASATPSPYSYQAPLADYSTAYANLTSTIAASIGNITAFNLLRGTPTTMP